MTVHIKHNALGRFLRNVTNHWSFCSSLEQKDFAMRLVLDFIGSGKAAAGLTSPSFKPFTGVTGVRIPVETPKQNTLKLQQLGGFFFSKPVFETKNHRHKLKLFLIQFHSFSRDLTELNVTSMWSPLGLAVLS